MWLHAKSYRGWLFLPLLFCAHGFVWGQNPESPLRRAAWESMQVDRESSVLLRDSNEGPVTARLAFAAEKVLKVTAADGHIEFEIGTDVQLSEDGFSLRFENCKGMEVVESSSLFPPKGAPNSYAHRKDHPEQNVFYAPGRWFHDHNVEITYTRREFPQNDLASVSITSGSLKTTLERLGSDRSLRIGVSGDSISTGLDASGTTNTPPNQPGYVELMKEALTNEFGAKVEVENRSVPGWSIANGIEDWPKLKEYNPDLVLIAYGMNDVGRRDPDWFEARLKELIGMIQRDLPKRRLSWFHPCWETPSGFIHLERCSFSIVIG